MRRQAQQGAVPARARGGGAVRAVVLVVVDVVAQGQRRRRSVRRDLVDQLEVQGAGIPADVPRERERAGGLAGQDLDLDAHRRDADPSPEAELALDGAEPQRETRRIGECRPHLVDRDGERLGQAHVHEVVRIVAHVAGRGLELVRERRGEVDRGHGVLRSVGGASAAVRRRRTTTSSWRVCGNMSTRRPRTIRRLGMAARSVARVRGLRLE